MFPGYLSLCFLFSSPSCLFSIFVVLFVFSNEIFGQFRKSVDFLCAGELLTIPAADQDPTRILHDDLWSRRLRGIEFVSVEVITGMVLEAWSRMKFEASRDRARRSGNGHSRLPMGIQESGGSETINTPAMLGEDRRDGETLFDPDASVQLRADEWDEIWQRDKAEQPRLYRALHACRAEASKAEHALPSISDGALARSVALIRNKKGIYWH